MINDEVQIVKKSQPEKKQKALRHYKLLKLMNYSYR